MTQPQSAVLINVHRLTLTSSGTRAGHRHATLAAGGMTPRVADLVSNRAGNWTRIQDPEAHTNRAGNRRKILDPEGGAPTGPGAQIGSSQGLRTAGGGLGHCRLGTEGQALGMLVRIGGVGAEIGVFQGGRKRFRGWGQTALGPEPGQGEVLAGEVGARHGYGDHISHVAAYSHHISGAQQTLEGVQLRQISLSAGFVRVVDPLLSLQHTCSTAGPEGSLLVKGYRDPQGHAWCLS